MTLRSEDGVEIAVTNKPLDHYEPYVALIASVMANAMALATDREFLLSLDQSAPLEESLIAQARESIRWRFAREIDRIEAER